MWPWRKYVYKKFKTEEEQKYYLMSVDLLSQLENISNVIDSSFWILLGTLGTFQTILQSQNYLEALKSTKSSAGYFDND